MLTRTRNISTNDRHVKLFSLLAQSAINAFQHFWMKRPLLWQDQRNERVAWLSTHSSDITYIDCQRFATDIFRAGGSKSEMHILNLAVTSCQQQHIPTGIEDGTIVTCGLFDIGTRGKAMRQTAYQFKFIQIRICHIFYLVSMRSASI